MEEGKMVLVMIAALAALIVGGGGTLWVVRTSVNAIVKQNAELTKSIGKNTEATTELTRSMNQYVAVQNERDKSLFRQLDRIERVAGRRRGSEETETH